ncbi:hypothetical protein F904_01441 [Acinetobacter dispersus]|uniref:Uncharacterized protein n=1 Tax=Acinetobacter dispersus TaxID=70348 RepID=N9MJB3_9GAMM|nr:hypothetical protein F904_01441 [Acinetobacter dispersus]
MNKKQVILSIIGSLIGSLGYSKTAARYDAITTACVMVNQAVENKLLTAEQVKQLGGANWRCSQGRLYFCSFKI